MQNDTHVKIMKCPNDCLWITAIPKATIRLRSNRLVARDHNHYYCCMVIVIIELTFKDYR